MQPITKHQSRIINDQRATSRYAKRKDIDRWHERRRLERQLQEPVS
ncbi:MAG: PA3496 family putative envelope integrity protein [Pseudomonadota bacterium]